MTKYILTEAQTQSLIAELFSQKMVQQLIDKFKQETPVEDQVVKFYIDRFQEIKNSPKVTNKDITTYSWKELKQVVDLNQPKIPGENQITIDDSNIIFEDQYVKITLANSEKACVHYGNGYTFCISARSDENAFMEYRFNEYNYTTYFFEDKQRSKEQISPGKFKDPQHLLVVMVGEDYTEEYQLDTESYGRPDIGEYKATPIKITDANNNGEHDFTHWTEVEDSEFSQITSYERYFEAKQAREIDTEHHKIEKDYKQNLAWLEREYEDLFKKKDEPYQDKDGRTVYPTRIRDVPWITVISSLHPSNIKKIDKLLAHPGIYHYRYKLTSRPSGYPQSYKSFERVTKKHVEDKISKYFLNPEISEFEETFHPFTDRYKKYLSSVKLDILNYLHEKNLLNVQ